MPNSWFQFQQFLINQDRCAMKVSTDAVMLGALAHSLYPSYILDVGTGTGVIALMLAQRFAKAEIQGVELDPAAATQARENFEGSIFADRLGCWQGRFQEFQPNCKFDMIVSNPPYFPDHLKSANSARNQALHTDSLGFGELIEHASRLLQPEGRFWVILPLRQMLDFRAIASEAGLHPFEIHQLQDRPDVKPHREIVGFTFYFSEILESRIIIKESDSQFHDSYRKLISGFLLNH